MSTSSATPLATREDGTPAPTIRIPFVAYRLRLRALTAVAFPDYAGSTWRGAFGQALKRNVCSTQNERCNNCPLLNNCAYPALFETLRPPQARQMRLYERIPSPMVIRTEMQAPRALAPGARTELSFILIGTASRFLPQAIEAFTLATRQGIGSGGGKLAVEGVDRMRDRPDGHWSAVLVPDGALEAESPASPVTPAWPGRVTLQFDTPLRLTSDGRTLGPDDITFERFFGSLLRRLSMLSYFHGDIPHEADFASLMTLSRRLSFAEADLHWHDWRRYSSRQGRHVPMGGVLGHALLAGEAFAPLWPYLWLGQWLHTGKGTIMGLGRYAFAAQQACETARAAKPGRYWC